jgi:nucleotide-binding universal stress UspA family protein
MYRRILIALEGKETDAAVLAHVKTLAAQTKAEVILLRVIAVADADDGTGLSRQWQLEVGSRGGRRKHKAVTYLSQLERELRQGGLRLETVLIIGARSEADEIARYAAENNCDLIAMASDSRPWYARWIAGSPASGVQRKATVPTLFIGDGSRKVPVARPAPKPNTMMAVFGSPCL